MRLHNLFESDTPESLTEDYLDIEITEDFAIETRILEFTPEGDAIVEIDDQALELMNLDEEQLNEFIPLIIGGAALGLTAYDAYKNYKAYKNGDITGKQLAQKVGTDAAIGLATGGVVKIAGKAYKGIKNLIKGKEAGAASTVVAKGAKELAPEIEPPSIANRSVAAVATQADDGIAAVQDRVQAKATKKSDAKKKAAKRAYRASNNSGFGSGSSYSDPLQRVIGKFNFEAVNPMVPFGNTKRKSTSHKQSKISSTEYQKVKKRKDFNASDWKWDGDQDLYVRESEYQGRKVKLNKPMQGDVKKSKVYVKNPKGNVVKVNFGHGGSSAKGKTMSIKKNNPARRKSFRARHNCSSPGPKHKARYWSCKAW
tara:strand:- start:987 stop:2093 length:1107 start_codon:yes stop_codon:yes gene_type:complete